MILKYVLHHKLLFVVGLYIVFSALLFTATGIDICLPCLWKTIFGFSCPGCGLSRAFTFLLKLQFISAFQANPLIYAVIPFSIFFIIKDFKKFKTKFAV